MTEDLSSGLERLLMIVFVLQPRATIYENVGGVLRAAIFLDDNPGRHWDSASYFHQLFSSETSEHSLLSFSCASSWRTEFLFWTGEDNAGESVGTC
jgi:hypothetical protein